MNVIECILEKMIGGSEKTRVVHQCNLANDKFQVYLDFLLSCRFIREVEETTETTGKGLAFLKDYRRLKASLVVSSEKHPKIRMREVIEQARACEVCI